MSSLKDFKGSLWKKPPPKDPAYKGGESWLELRRQEEGAEGLWRIHNKLYDLSNFIAGHPGGSDWITVTKVSNEIKQHFKTHLCKKRFSRFLSFSLNK